jgi:hypothetical protein
VKSKMTICARAGKPRRAFLRPEGRALKTDLGLRPCSNGLRPHSRSRPPSTITLPGGMGRAAELTILRARYIRPIYVVHLHRQDAHVRRGRSDPSLPLDVSSLDLAPLTRVGGAFSLPPA